MQRRSQLMIAAAVATAAVTGAIGAVLAGSEPPAASPAVTRPAAGPTTPDVLDVRVPRCVGGPAMSCFEGAAATALSDLLTVLDEQGPSEALAALRTAVDTSPAWVPQCHDMAHVLGQAAGRAHSPTGLLGLDERLCLEGFSHGILEGFALASDDVAFAATVRELCLEYTSGNWEGENCAHSVGHAVALRPHETLTEVFLACDLLPDRLRTSCGVGAVMAIASPTASFDPADRPVPDELDRLCAELPDRYRNGCFLALWQFYPSTWDSLTLVERLIPVCAAAGPSRVACFEGVGIGAYFRGLLGDARGSTPDTVRSGAASVLDVCRRLGPDGPACAGGVANASALWWATLGWSFDSYLSPCDQLDGELSVGCRAGEDGQKSGADPNAPPFPPGG
jgi:hypothetical protein